MRDLVLILHTSVKSIGIETWFFRSMHICKNIGEVAAIETTTNMFKRVEVLELKMDDKYEELRTVKVKFMDDGRIDDVRVRITSKLR